MRALAAKLPGETPSEGSGRQCDEQESPVRQRPGACADIRRIRPVGYRFLAVLNELRQTTPLAALCRLKAAHAEMRADLRIDLTPPPQDSLVNRP
jgi:hypothetical protein